MKILCKILCPMLVLAGLLTPVRALSPEEQAISDSCKYNQETDLSEFEMTQADLNKLFHRLMDQGDLPWYTTEQYQYTYNEADGMIQSFTPGTLSDAYDRVLYEEKLAELMEQCIHPGMTPAEIALSVHDKLILMSRYDETLQKNTAYDLLINGSTVCNGYTVLYRDILNRAGIPCISVSSVSMEHTWNMVQLDGQWYHADLTWDDPTPDMIGVVRHDYFLLTDAQISSGQKPHYNWPPTVSSTDDRYRLAYWRDLSSPVLFPGDGNAWYLMEEDLAYRLVKRDLSTGEETLMFREKTPTVLDLGQGGDYTYLHTGLSLRDGRLYFGTLNKVHSMDLEGNMRTEYEFDTDSTQRYIYSCYAQDDTLYLMTATHDGDMKEMQVPLAPTEGKHIHSYTRTETPATCRDPGCVVSQCDCGLQLESQWSLLPHSYASTSPDEGHTREACTVCGAIRITGTVTVETVPVTQDDPLPGLSRKPLLFLIPGCALLVLPLLFGRKRR